MRSGSGGAVIGIVFCLTAMLAVGPARGNESIQIAFHLTGPNWKHPCAQSSEEFQVSGNLTPSVYLAHLLVVQEAGDSPIRGIQFGIHYDQQAESGIDLYGWHACGSHELPATGWPADGTSNMIVWDRGSEPVSGNDWGLPGMQVRVIGYFYCAAPSPGVLSLAGVGNSNDIRVIREDGTRDVIPVAGFERAGSITTESTGNMHHSPVGYIALSSDAKTPGYNPVQRIQSKFDIPTAQPGAEPIELRAAWNRETSTGRFNLHVTQPGLLRLSLFDVSGRLIRTIVDEPSVEIGDYAFDWDGRTIGGEEVPSGMYFAKVLRGTSVSLARMVVVR